MISARRILLGLFLGALLVAGLTVTFAEDTLLKITLFRVDSDGRATLANPRSVLRTDMPAMDPEPANTATPLYSPAWWAAQAEVEKFREKYPEPILIVTPGLVDRPVYVFAAEGAANSMIVTPMYRLPLYADAIRAGRVVWCPLRDAFAVLASTAAPGSDAESPAVAEAARLRAAITQAIETLSSVE